MRQTLGIALLLLPLMTGGCVLIVPIFIIDGWDQAYEPVPLSAAGEHYMSGHLFTRDSLDSRLRAANEVHILTRSSETFEADTATFMNNSLVLYTSGKAVFFSLDSVRIISIYDRTKATRIIHGAFQGAAIAILAFLPAWLEADEEKRVSFAALAGYLGISGAAIGAARPSYYDDEHIILLTREEFTRCVEDLRNFKDDEQSE